MEQAMKEITEKNRNLVIKMRNYSTDDLIVATVDRCNAKLETIESLRDDLVERMETVAADFASEMTQQDAVNLRANIVKVEADVKQYLRAMNVKAHTLRMEQRQTSDVLTNDAASLRMAAAFEKSLEKAEAAKESSLDESRKEARSKTKTAIAKARAKYDAIVEEIEELKESVTEVTDWSKASSITVGRAMNKIKSWKDGFDKVNKMHKELKVFLIDQSITEDEADVSFADALVNDISDVVKKAIREVEKEDDDRALFSLDKSKTDPIKLPTFEGRDDEDFSRFKEEMERGFLQNRICKDDRVAKLRERLKGFALKIVPENNSKSIEEAWSDLANAFGDPTKVMNFRKQALLKLGPMPRSNAKGQKSHKGQIEWFLQLESLLGGIIQLGNESEDLKFEAFPGSFVRKIVGLFPEETGKKLMHVQRECSPGPARLEAILKKITFYREESQMMQQVDDMKLGDGDGQDGTGGGRGGGATSKQNNTSGPAGPELRGCVAYRPPRRDENCRICKTLEAAGDTTDLYDDHVHNFPTGCPRYMKMNVSQRYKIASKALLCLKCHDPEYIWKKNDRTHKCPISKDKKSKYTCKRCEFHLWICNQHKDDNQEALKKFKDEVQNKYNIDFGLLTRFCLQRGNTSAKKAQVKEAKSGLVSPKLKKKVKNINKTQVKEAQPSLESPGLEEIPMAVPCDHNSMSTNQATKKLKKKLKIAGSSGELHPIAKGRAQFMLGQCEGKSRALGVLYDTGCYGVLFAEGVPQNELRPAVRKTKGPFVVKGVGDTSVRVNDEYMCSVPLRDGSRQALEGWTVDKVTAAFPMINMTKAEKELKDDDKSNEKLQALKVQPEVGGDCDILLGLMYKSIFPVLIHSLPSGLEIYELKVLSHKKEYTAVIGGPHESFEMMMNQVGSMNLLFVNLMKQLDNYKKMGPPDISRALMSKEDIEFAKNNKEWDLGSFGDGLLDDVDLDIDEEDQESLELLTFHPACPDDIDEITGKIPELADDEPFEEIDMAPRASKKDDIKCSECGDKLDADGMEVLQNLPARADDDEDTTVFKRMIDAQHDGLQIQYRCPRCRECSDCRRSYETERISLREEAEDLMINESITIDWEKKMIVCYLPLRGKAEDFLSDNRDIALRILDQQCKKYHADDETRELITKAFEKLLKNGQMVMFDELTEEQKKKLESQPVSHYLIWRVVFKASLSTPARPVFDGSSRTKFRADGSGGRCLNDCVVKGRVVSLNLVKMVMRFCIGLFALQGDLKQFYASIKLVEEQWNLQRVLYRENLDPNGEVKEALIKTLIWGIKCVSAQSECTVLKLADIIDDDYPRLAEFLRNDRFVDDLAGSDISIEILEKLASDADNLFHSVGLACKGWTFSGKDPSEDVAECGMTVSVGGMKWHPKIDVVEVPFPGLYFNNNLGRGKILIGNSVFEGSTLDDLDKFVPQKLTRRMIFSKNAAIFDLNGKFVPVMSDFKVDLREAVKQTQGWDDPVPMDLRAKWVRNFHRLERLRGLKFHRARMPANAVNTDMDVIIAVDAAEPLKVVGAWGRFKLESGDFSCQLIIGRSLLADEDSTIPKNELDALTMGSNLGWILRQALEKWVKSFILIGDSTISLCWVTSEKKRLSLFHRNRVSQIKRGTEIDKIFHVITECNPADLGTRPAAVLDSDVGPNSKWEVGLPWMKKDIDDAINQGILTPATSLRLTEEEEEDFKKGVVFEKSPEILTRGHPAVLMTARVENVKSRAEYSKYIVSPTKFKFERIVRIIAIVKRFIDKVSKGKFENKFTMKMQMFPANKYEDPSSKSLKDMMADGFDKDYPEFAGMSFGVKKPGLNFRGKHFVLLSDDEISWSLNYLFRKGSDEVKEFQKPDFIKKIAVEKNGTLFARSRILDGQRFEIEGGLEGTAGLAEMKINLMTPVLDRYSPLSYAIADYVHRKVANHKGYENCLRESLNHCYIIQGLSLYREVGEDCAKCLKMRKKYLELATGPVPKEQMILAPAFWIAMCDIYGPCHVYVPGHSMRTRNKDAIEVKVYILVFVCPTTKLTNLQVIESKSADGVAEGVTRLGCEVGLPSYVLTDQDSGILKVLKDASVQVKDLQLLLHKEKGIKFRTCPVSGHYYHGLVERRIRTVQESLDKVDIKNQRLHATGLQTLAKIVENDFNNLPLGFGYSRDGDNSPLLKLIFPNMLKIGRVNKRALQGPVRLPKGPGDLMKKVEKLYDVFYKVWNTTMVPILMKSNKWFDTKAELRVNDLVYFRKEESELSSTWTVGRIASVEKGKDGVVRRADVEYHNATENFPRTTDRAARSLIKLFHIDDENWQSDMDKVEELVKAVEDDDMKNSVYTMTPTGDGLRFKFSRDENALPGKKIDAWVAKRKLTKKACVWCCCIAHCRVTSHERGAVCAYVPTYPEEKQIDFPYMLDRSWMEVAECEAEVVPASKTKDQFMSMLCALDTNFDGED